MLGVHVTISKIAELRTAMSLVPTHSLIGEMTRVESKKLLRLTTKRNGTLYASTAACPTPTSTWEANCKILRV